jgi:anhydro-N-acetylmuramic acid kinase
MAVKFWNVIGLMSGTSLDGLDIVYVQFIKNEGKFDFKLIATETIPYSKTWEHNLRNAFNASEEELCRLNISYGNYLGVAINSFIKKNQIGKVDFIASHGHTIFHKPNEGFTLQIGDGKTICDATGLKVICDFRTQDVELGGQGAPLVPIGDKLLFSAYEYCLNLGGFANISFENEGKRIAFDICPVNIILNYYAQKLGFKFDENGILAASGIIDESLLNELNKLSFYTLPFPKSLGFEFVKETIFPLIQKHKLAKKDILRTFVTHIVFQISNCLNQKNGSKVLVTGGGAFNTFLINELKKQAKNEFFIPRNDLVNFKEALIFGLLGVLKSENQINCLSSVTGAKKDHISGKIFTKGA